MVGQVLYLEAEETGIRSTGIGCYFDNLVHEAFGITSRAWQSFYHSPWVAQWRTHGSPRYLHTPSGKSEEGVISGFAQK
jgi:hypothetical protein